MSPTQSLFDDSVGWLAIIGTGPGDTAWLTPETADWVTRASDLVGYERYVARVADHGQRRHVSDNREELQRAAHALDMAADGARVVVVSGGDPGIFGMAAAIWEAIDTADHGRWANVPIHVAPAVSAIQAVAAAAGAPLGNDFCVMSLSDNLKPWVRIEKRLAAVGSGDFAAAFYNPISKARPWQLGRAMTILGGYRQPDTPVVVGTAIGRADARLMITTLADFRPEQADMRTLVIVGASTTRVLHRDQQPTVCYTPRFYSDAS